MVYVTMLFNTELTLERLHVIEHVEMQIDIDKFLAI